MQKMMDTKEGFKLYVIDDDYTFRTAALAFFETEGFTGDVEVFVNGLEAYDHLAKIEAASAKPPDLVFLDLNMPVMSGWQFIEKLKRSDHYIQHECSIFILTSSVDSGDYLLSNEYDFIDGYITKPLTKSDFAKVVKEVKA